MGLNIPKKPAEILTPITAIKPSPRAVKHVVRMASKMVTEDHVHSVTFSDLLCPEGKNHLFSLKPYFWEVQPGKWERRDGHRNPYCDRPQGQTQLQKMAQTVHTLSLAIANLGPEEGSLKKQCLQRLEKILRAFFVDQETMMHPEARYAQCSPGDKPLKADNSFEIALRYILLVSQTLPLVAELLPRDLIDHMRRWLAAQVQWMETCEQGQAVKQYGDNKTVWYHAIIATHLSFLSPKEGQAYANSFFSQWLREHPDPPSFFAAELRRTRPRHYSLFILEPTFILAAFTRSPSGQLPANIANYLAKNVSWAATIQCGNLERPLEEGGRYEACLEWFEYMLEKWNSGKVRREEPNGEPWEGGWGERSKVAWGFI